MSNRPLQELARPYSEALETIVQALGRQTEVCVLLYGSVASGETSFLQGSRIPASDIDLLVVSATVDGFSRSAAILTDLDASFRRTATPFFKLGIKFRTLNELMSSDICINELSALKHGEWLTRPVHVVRPEPSLQWYERQAALSLITRLNYDCKRLSRLSSRDRAAYEPYVAARTVLEVATVFLVSRGHVPSSHERAVDLFESRPTYSAVSCSLPSNIDDDVRSALNFKLRSSPDFRMTLSNAQELLTDCAQAVGVMKSEASVQDESVLSAMRPLDARDQEIRRMAEPLRR